MIIINGHASLTLVCWLACSCCAPKRRHHCITVYLNLFSIVLDEECVDLNCVHTEPASLPARLHSVIDTMNASNVETLNRIMQLKELQVKPTGKRLLFITAASSNHYLEFQAMLKNFHETVAPNFSNYSLIFYDIGLTLQERAEVNNKFMCRHIYHKHTNALNSVAWCSFEAIVIDVMQLRN